MSHDETDEEEARRAKAASLRARIAQLKPSGTGKADDSDTQSPSNETSAAEPRTPAPKHQNPRDFIHDRMHELDAEEKDEKKEE
jgi:hypothetical protein